MTIKKFPAKIFVKWDFPGGSEEAFLLADEDMYGLVDSGRKKSRIGIYQLVETTDAEMVVSTSKPVKAPNSPPQLRTRKPRPIVG